LHPVSAKCKSGLFLLRAAAMGINHETAVNVPAEADNVIKC